ncbi:zinc finger protein 22 [Magallana gigas]|uniref:zinc finger protein 22 n=1 Tax=Magallana gigas TaxID=29159 RepID=UPI0033411C23
MAGQPSVVVDFEAGLWKAIRETINAEMARQRSLKLPYTGKLCYKLPSGKTVVIKLVDNLRSAQEEHSISSSSTQQGNEDESSSCDEICCSSIKTATSQENSKSNTETTAVKSNKCYICGKSFSTSSSLRRHSKFHKYLERKVRIIINKNIQKKELTFNPTVDDRQREFECGECGRKFTRKEHVMRHMMTHTGESMYTCEVCGKGYGSQKAFKKHINIHTGDDIEVDEDDTGSSSSSDSSAEVDMEDC